MGAKLDQWANLRQQSAETFLARLLERINELHALLGTTASLSQVEIIAGHDKSGQPEMVPRIFLQRGDLLAIVGPTGSGKSRLLADIEWLATGDALPAVGRSWWMARAPPTNASPPAAIS